MKKYRTAVTLQILCIFTLLFIIIVGFIGMIKLKRSLFEQIVVFGGIIFAILGTIAMSSIKINTDEQKIEMFALEIMAIILCKIPIGITHKVLNWNEIGELRSTYTIFAESPIIALIPKPGVNKKPIEFMGFPLELVKDILAHLPPDAKVSLYPYLKRKLEGKQTWFYVK